MIHDDIEGMTDESGEMWAKISEIDKKVALNEHKIRENDEAIKNVIVASEKRIQEQNDKRHRAAARANNYKVAIVGGLFAGFSAIIIYFHGVFIQ